MLHLPRRWPGAYTFVTTGSGLALPFVHGRNTLSKRDVSATIRRADRAAMAVGLTAGRSFDEATVSTAALDHSKAQEGANDDPHATRSEWKNPMVRRC